MSITAKEVQTLRTLIAKTDRDDLNMIINMVKAQQTAISQMSAASFRTGQTVKFTGRRGVTVRGTVQKVNTKNVKVRADDGTLWNVAGALLKAV